LNFFTKFREIPVISSRDVTHEQGTDGLTDRAVLLAPYKDVKGPENKLTALRLKQEKLAYARVTN